MTQQSTFTAVIHGESGAGKSQLADTIPGPRLILDAEGGSEFTPSWPKQIWNPDVYGPPVKSSVFVSASCMSRGLLNR